VWFVALCAVALQSTIEAADEFHSTVSGAQGSIPAGYVPPLVSNGSLSMLIDYQGGQSQRVYGGMTPGIWWEGRRYGPPHDQLAPFGHFEQELSLAGKTLTAPVSWTQTLNTKEAVVTCRNDYAGGLVVETVVFTPLAHDLIVVKKRISTSEPSLQSARLTFKYQFTPPGSANHVPRRTTCTSKWDEAARNADFRYQLDGHPGSSGIISVFSNKPVSATVDKQAVALSADVKLDAARPAELTFYVLLADSLDGKDYGDRAARLRSQALREGFDGLLAAHRQEWGKYWNESRVQLPDERLQKVYCTAQYHLRANATKWSFPVGIFPTHWAGRFFGWDEMFCYQALISSNHRDIARRCPEFRFAGLPKALQRASHYGSPGMYGARFPWEALEDGSEAVPPGFWMDHVFHMSNIAVSAWFQYLYTNDAEYLKKTGYPVVRECARFFLANMVYESPDGGMFLGKCTDLERLGPAKIRPFLTSCGAIYTLEAAAQAAELLKENEKEAAAWKHASAKLRESLPHDGEKYIPYPGCTERSIASLGGLFPYPLFDETNLRQRKAVLDFVAKGRASGNMYPVGNSVCAWYAGWMAATLAALGEKAEPIKLLSEVAGGAGCFGEMFEINEAKVSMHPWFATASGNVVYAMNQMLVQSRGSEILVAAGVPESWRDYAFKLACHGDLVAEVAVKDGRLVRLVLTPGNRETQLTRTLVLPERLVNPAAFNKALVVSTTARSGCLRLETRFKGEAVLVGSAN
jgi:hypothetical protein